MCVYMVGPPLVRSAEVFAPPEAGLRAELHQLAEEHLAAEKNGGRLQQFQVRCTVKQRGATVCAK